MKVKTLICALAGALAAPCALAGKTDFNNDGRADVFWRNSMTGENYIYPLDGTAILGTEGYTRTVADQNWQVAGIGDFDGDGRGDILWRNFATGENYIYLMNGTSITAEGYLRTVADQNWTVVAVADFTGDSKDDILWRNIATGENYLYPMNGLAIAAGEGYVRTVADQNWTVVGAGDFDGDTRADVLWRNASTGENYVYFMNGAAISGEGYIRTVASQDWQVVGVGDVNADARADIFWRNVATGDNYIYPMNGLAILPGEGYTRSVTDLEWHVAGVADYSGDGRADILWRKWTTGESYVYVMNGTSIASEGYLRTVDDAAWIVAGNSAPLAAALVGAQRMLNQLAFTINAQGDALARSHVLGFYDENFLAGGFNRSQDAAFMVNDIRGIEVVKWTHGRVMNYNPATQTLKSINLLRLDAGGGAFDDRFAIDFRRQSDGSWKLWGDHLYADVNVKIQMSTTANGPGRFNEGPTQKAFVNATSAQGTVQEVRITGAGVFNNSIVTKSPGSVEELVQADPPPAERESIYKDSFFTSANTSLSAPADFSVTVTPVSGVAQTYDVRSNTVTDQYVTITSPTGHTLAAANLGSPLTVHWTLPAFEVEFVEFAGAVRTILDSNAGSQCHIIGPDLGPEAISAQITLPSTCNGQAVQEAWVNVIVTGANGERTSYLHGFANPLP